MQKVITVPNFIVVLLLVSAGAFMLNAAIGDSAIFDETAHIVAGYTYVRHLDYRFNPEHPPLVKMLAGTPLLFQGLTFSRDQGYWEGVNEQWWAGNEFLYQSGNNADRIILWARVAPMLFALLLIWFTYYWSRELIGRWWALLPAALLAFSPIVLSHGHYVTNDVGAAVGIMIALYFFLQLLYKYSVQNLLYAGIAFGVAQSIKFSAVILTPYFFIIAVLFYFAHRFSRKEVEVSREDGTFEYYYEYAVEVKNTTPWYMYIWRTFLVMALGYALVVYPLYFLTTWNYSIEKQVLDTQVNIQNFAIRPVADLNIWMARNAVLRPFAQYMKGLLMVLQRSAGGNDAFFLGQVSSQGWWYYFPVAYLMKEPFATLLILLMGIKIGLWNAGVSFRRGIRRAWYGLKEYASTHFSELAMMLFVVLYWASSIASPLNIGVRHILPAVPFMYMLSAGAIRGWFAVRPVPLYATLIERLENIIHTIFNFWVKGLVLGSLLVWLALETLFAAPYFLSYFNNISGWQENGFYYITDSNFDWGQDLKRLRSWTEEHLAPEEKIAVDYFGGGDLEYYFGDRAEPWQSSRGNPINDGIQWLAISANTLQGALATPGGGFYRNPADEYRWLENPYGFTDRAGTSIFIYSLTNNPQPTTDNEQ